MLRPFFLKDPNASQEFQNNLFPEKLYFDKFE